MPSWQDAEDATMAKKPRPPTKDPWRKLSDAERRAAEKEFESVSEERFQEVLRRLVTTPPPKRRHET